MKYFRIRADKGSMRTVFWKILFSFICVGLLTSTLSSPARAEEFSQIQALADAQQLNKDGSDRSMEASTTTAMRALMELAKQNRSAAISNGYKAFGQYRNSEDMDVLRMRNTISALKLDSIGNYLQSSGKSSIFIAPPSDYNTSYRRLNSDFLRKGEAGKVASEFEKVSGMSRETFLKHMITASESDIRMSDPNLVNKVISKFEGFVKEIPNEEFRGKIQSEISKVPKSMRSGIISEAIQKTASMFAGAGSDRGAPVTKGEIRPAAKEGKPLMQAFTGVPDSNVPSKASNSSGANERLPASFGGSTPALVGGSEYRGIDQESLGSDPVGRVLQTALDEQTEDTIFKQISRKYRSLSNALKARSM